MKSEKQKTYVLIVSGAFPAYHTKAGQPTGFEEKILSALEAEEGVLPEGVKIHTIRSNYELWSDRIAEVRAGFAVLSIRKWSGKPYRSKQVEIARITKDNNPGVQRAFIKYSDLTGYEALIDGWELFGANEREQLAKNDGLTGDDFSEWFFKRGKIDEFSGVVIHFTNFRY